MTNCVLRLVFYLYFVLNVCAEVVWGQSQNVTLHECFRLALERSSSVAISSEQIRQTDAQIKQARSGYFPTLTLQASSTEQAESTNPLAKSLSSTRQSTTNVNLSQNLFQGFRDASTIEQRKNLKNGFEWSKKQAVQQLYKDVAQAFYSILIFQSDMSLYREQIDSTGKRKSELGSAKKSGRARDSDILTAESSIASLEAAISRTQGLVVVYQEAFTYLTGLSKNVKLIDSAKLPEDFKSVEKWVAKSEQRPDIQQSKSYLLASENAIESAKSGFYPTLGLSANYYMSRPTGIFQGVDWDTSLVLSFPFFSGGMTNALVNEAHSLNQSKKLMLKQNQEIAEQTIRSAYSILRTDMDQLQKLTTASELSRRSYELVHRDNRLGVATNTDVLTALQVWQESKRNLERTRITTIYDYVKLRLETSEDLDQISGGKNE